MYNFLLHLYSDKNKQNLFYNYIAIIKYISDRITLYGYTIKFTLIGTPLTSVENKA